MHNKLSVYRITAVFEKLNEFIARSIFVIVLKKTAAHQRLNFFFELQIVLLICKIFSI